MLSNTSGFALPYTAVSLYIVMYTSEDYTIQSHKRLILQLRIYSGSTTRKTWQTLRLLSSWLSGRWQRLARIRQQSWQGLESRWATPSFVNQSSIVVRAMSEVSWCLHIPLLKRSDEIRQRRRDIVFLILVGRLPWILLGSVGGVDYMEMISSVAAN